MSSKGRCSWARTWVLPALMTLTAGCGADWDDVPTTQAMEHGSGDAQRVQALTDRAAEGGVDLIFLGDSITQGWETTGREVWARYYAPRRALNLGVIGDRIQNVLWRMEHGNLDGISPRAAVVLIGTNNTGDGEASAAEISVGIAQVVSRLRSRLPGAQVLLLGILPRGERPGSQGEKVRRTNELLRAMDLGPEVTFLDLGASLLEADGTISTRVMPDFLHLSGEGYRRLAAGLEQHLVRVMER